MSRCPRCIDLVDLTKRGVWTMPEDEFLEREMDAGT